MVIDAADEDEEPVSKPKGRKGKAKKKKKSSSRAKKGRKGKKAAVVEEEEPADVEMQEDNNEALQGPEVAEPEVLAEQE